DRISGKGFDGLGVLEGTLSGDKLEFRMVTDGKLRGEFTGNVQGDLLSGSVRFTNNPFARFSDHYDWTARRALPRPAAPTRHEFDPTRYYRNFSDAPLPALRIFPGDTVHTHTI